MVRLRSRIATWAVILGGFLFLHQGCRSTSIATPLSEAELATALEFLSQPLPGDPAALYQLRVPSSGGLRLSVRTSGGSGRFTVSEPFGSAVSISAWTGSEPPTYFDLRESCRLEAADLSQILGIDAFPLPGAVRLLGGRLPVESVDSISLRSGGRLFIKEKGWSAFLVIGSDPWRVVSIYEHRDDGNPGWIVELSDHTSSVPGSLRIEQRNGRWAELKLVRLEWKDGEVLPALPVFPLCAAVLKS